MMPLSPKERRFLDLIDQGNSYKEICEALQIKLPTARTYARRIVKKTFCAAGIHRAAYLRWQAGELRQPVLSQFPAMRG